MHNDLQVLSNFNGSTEKVAKNSMHVHVNALMNVLKSHSILHGPKDPLKLLNTTFDKDFLICPVLVTLEEDGNLTRSLKSSKQLTYSC